MSSRCSIAMVITLPVSAVVLGSGAAVVLGMPALSSHATLLLPVVVLATIVIAPLIAWRLAPRLSARHRRQAATKRRLLEERARRELLMPNRHFIQQRVPVAARAAPRLSSPSVAHWR